MGEEVHSFHCESLEGLLHQRDTAALAGVVAWSKVVGFAVDEACAGRLVLVLGCNSMNIQCRLEPAYHFDMAGAAGGAGVVAVAVGD